MKPTSRLIGAKPSATVPTGDAKPSAEPKRHDGFYAFDDKDGARNARTFIYQKSERLADLFEYGRSRLRICRGTFVNAVLFVFAANGFVVRHAGSFSQPERLAAALSVGGLAVAAGAYWAWRRLLHSESAWLRTQYKYLGGEDGPAKAS